MLGRGAAASSLPVMQNANVYWNGQPVAVVIAGTLDQAAVENKKTNTEIMQSSEVKVPKPIDDFVAAVNGGDTEKFLAFFDEKEGVINDWGSKYVGHAAIKGWSDKEFIGAKGTMTPTGVERKDNEIKLWAGWKSNFYTGDSLFIFTVDGEKSKEMRIESAK
jgi:hypothetical protein